MNEKNRTGKVLLNAAHFETRRLGDPTFRFDEHAIAKMYLRYDDLSAFIDLLNWIYIQV
ncbi:MAG: hypothetical protein JXB38_22520 [Anaerolineales bacterium]|nr:hypothetical protein [Anaerolineales bacterium]